MFTTLMQYFRLIMATMGLVGLTFLFYHKVKNLLDRYSPLNIQHKGLKLCLILFSLGLSIGSFLGLSSFYVYHGFDHQPDIYRNGNRDLPMVSLTFDDGPSPIYTPQILEILKEYEVPAAFFLVGSNVEKYPEVALAISENGHEIGNHTQNHRNIPTLGITDLNQEVIEGTAKIIEATNQYPDYIRPPRGMYDGRFRRLTALLGQQVVLWTVSSKDWQVGVTADTIVHNVMSKVKNGDIILFMTTVPYWVKKVVIVPPPSRPENNRTFFHHPFQA